MVTSVQSKRLTEAARCWYAADLGNIKENYNESFEEYCNKRFMCDSFTLSNPKRDKKMYVVFFYGILNGTNKTYSLYAEKVNGRWVLREQLIINPEHVGPLR